ncbi:MAG: hypothetical protein ACU4EQ_13230 [Candidatus Nitrosoglobus sp.]
MAWSGRCQKRIVMGFPPRCHVSLKLAASSVHTARPHLASQRADRYHGRCGGGGAQHARDRCHLALIEQRQFTAEVYKWPTLKES